MLVSWLTGPRGRGRESYEASEAFARVGSATAREGLESANEDGRRAVGLPVYVCMCGERCGEGECAACVSVGVHQPLPRALAWVCLSS